VSTLTITHTPAEGTTLAGDPRPHHDILKTAGWRWARGGKFWFVPNSRDHAARTAVIDRTAEALRAAGFTVEVEVDDTVRPFAEVEADRIGRLEGRPDALAAKADALSAASDARFARAEQLVGGIPFGQPMMPGHHSYKADLSRRTKAADAMDKGVELYREAQAAEHAAAASAAHLRHREAVPTTLRRIARLTAELRKIERNLAGKQCFSAGARLKADAPEMDTYHCRYCGTDVAVVDRVIAAHYGRDNRPADGAYGERQRAERDRLTDEIAYWTAHVAAQAEAGAKVWSKADFKKGDYVRCWVNGNGAEVVRVNAKSVTVKTQYSWTETIPYSDIKGMTSAEAVAAARENSEVK
jgi:hypothetical protein